MMYRNRNNGLGLIGAAGSAFSAVLLATGIAHAVQINVDSNCSITQAFQTLGSMAPAGGCEVGTGTGDVIQLQGTTYTTGKLIVTRPVTIRGATNGLTKIISNHPNMTELLYVNNTQYPAAMTVTIENVALEGASPSNDTSGIYARGTGDSSYPLHVYLDRVRISGFGWSGFYSEDTDATLTSSVIMDNESWHSGGGVSFRQITGHVALIIESCTIANNISEGDGGGVYYQGSGNSNMYRSTLSGNVALRGGGLFLKAENQLYFQTERSTIAYNSALTSGGGVANGSLGTYHFYDSIIANNAATVNQDGDTWGGGVEIRNTLVGDTAGMNATYLYYDVDLRNLDPMIDPLLFDMGGAAHTKVHRLLPGSPLIDYRAESSHVDQRGFAAPRDGDGNGSALRDVGAYEHDPNWQTESLLVAGMSSGDSHGVTTSSGADTSTTYSAGKGTRLVGNAVNDYVTYAVPVPETGTYNVKVRVRRNNFGSRFRLAVSNSPTGPWTNIGSEQDLYASSSSFAELNLASNLNMSSTGQKYFRFLVTGKNPQSTTFYYYVDLDYIRLTKL